jgi:hypothetical protein
LPRTNTTAYFVAELATKKKKSYCADTLRKIAKKTPREGVGEFSNDFKDIFAKI